MGKGTGGDMRVTISLMAGRGVKYVVVGSRDIDDK